MADSITKCVEFFDSSDNVDYRVIHYRLEYAAYVLNTSVVVRAAEMTDSTDLDECRTIANAKAAIEKGHWIDSLANPSSEEEVVDLNGSVSL